MLPHLPTSDPARFISWKSPLWVMCSLLQVSLASATATDDEASLDDSAVVALPPFLVEPDRPFRWNRVAGPGFELLTTHDQSFGRSFAENYYHQRELIRLVIPDRYLWQFADAETFIIVEPGSSRPKSDALLNRLLESKDVSTRRGRRRVFLPNFGLSGADCSTTFGSIDPSSVNGSFNFDDDTGPRFGRQRSAESFRFHANTNRISERLFRAEPALPIWAIHGLIDVYDSCKFVSSWIDVTPLDRLIPAPTKTTPSGLDDTPSDDEHGNATVAISPVTMTDQESPEAQHPLINLAFIFQHPAPQEKTLQAKWREQARLFVRWALFADDRVHQEAFWKFINRHELAVLNEESFLDCFNLSFANAENRIAAYRESGATKPLSLRLKEFTLPSNITASRARRSDVARILSNWERLETDHVRKIQPELEDVYLTRARNTIAAARRDGHDSPELTAISGLLEFEAGNSVTAESELERAFAQGVRRPHLLQALASLRFDIARAQVPADEKLDITQIGPTLSLLRLAHESTPAIPATYSQFVEMWDRSDEPILREDLAIMASGARHFPQHAKVILPIALLQVRRGKPQMALQVLNYAQARTHQFSTYEIYRNFVAQIQEPDTTPAPEAP
jgi:hypothetical protein